MGIGPTRGMSHTLEGFLGRWHRGPALRVLPSRPSKQTEQSDGDKAGIQCPPKPCGLALTLSRVTVNPRGLKAVGWLQGDTFQGSSP